MREEVNAAVTFLSKFMQSKLSKDSLEQFKMTLVERLQYHYKDHWFPELPNKGSGYRCIRINNQVMDPLLYSAAQESGIADLDTRKLFPEELTMWVDPRDVSYRIGENGSIGQVEVNTSDRQPISYQKIHDLAPETPYSKGFLTSCKDEFVRGFHSPGSTFRFGMRTQYAAFAS